MFCKGSHIHNIWSRGMCGKAIKTKWLILLKHSEILFEGAFLKDKANYIQIPRYDHIESRQMDIIKWYPHRDKE